MRHDAPLFRRNTRGFTIIEMMIVVLILGIMVAVAVPGFREAFATQRVKAAGKTLYSALKQARSEAQRMNGICEVYLVPEDSTNWASELHLVAVTNGGGVPAFDATAGYGDCQFDSAGDGYNAAHTGDIAYSNPLAVFPAQEYVTGTPAAALASIQFNLLGRATAAVPAIAYCDDAGYAQAQWTVNLDAAGLPWYNRGSQC